MLGILAAVVIPQYNLALEDTKRHTLQTNLGTVRGHLQFYRVQHKGNYPTPANLVQQLTMTTDADGATTGTEFGPYLMSFPTNSFNDLSTVDITTQGGGNAGWYYTVSGGTAIFTADTDDHTGE